MSDDATTLGKVNIRWRDLDDVETTRVPTNFIEWEAQQRLEREKAQRRNAAVFESTPSLPFQYCDIDTCDNVKEPFDTYRGKRVPNKFCPKHEEQWKKFRARKFTIAQFVDIAGRIECDCCGVALPQSAKKNMDHDHSIHPGQQWCAECFRGVVCTRCNNLLGALDDKYFFAQAQRYLNR